jgi:uncharacterized protein
LFNRLQTLYQLQLIDDQLDELEELRGDLPNTVRDLEEKIKLLRENISGREKEQKDSVKKREENEVEAEKAKENQKKFKAQLYQVRNNKEYDALTKEIDYAEEQLRKIEAENNALADLSKKLSAEIEEILPELKTLEQDLKIKQVELREIIKTNEKEDAKLQAERTKVETQTRKPDYSTYMRIRKAKRGKAVVTIRRAACSGCNNVVPPQRQLEIRRNNKLFFCEYCGRILVSSEVSEAIEKK